MTTERSGFLLAALIVVVALLIARFLLKTDPDARNWEFFPEMVYSSAGESFAVNAFMPGGRVMQPLPEGVVVRGYEPFPFGDSTEEAQRAGEVLSSPLSPDDQLAAENGARLYAIYCVVCHGGDGEGQGPAVLRGMVPPPSYMSATSTGMKDGQMFHILTLGRGNMSSFAAQLSPTERWSVIRHIRGIQEGQ